MLIDLTEYQIMLLRSGEVHIRIMSQPDNKYTEWNKIADILDKAVGVDGN